MDECSEARMGAKHEEQDAGLRLKIKRFAKGDLVEELGFWALIR